MDTWGGLRHLALQADQSLSPAFIRSLIRSKSGVSLEAPALELTPADNRRRLDHPPPVGHQHHSWLPPLHLAFILCPHPRTPPLFPTSASRIGGLAQSNTGRCSRRRRDQSAYTAIGTDSHSRTSDAPERSFGRYGRPCPRHRVYPYRKCGPTAAAIRNVTHLTLDPDTAPTAAQYSKCGTHSRQSRHCYPELPFQRDLAEKPELVERMAMDRCARRVSCFSPSGLTLD